MLREIVERLDLQSVTSSEYLSLLSDYEDSFQSWMTVNLLCYFHDQELKDKDIQMVEVAIALIVTKLHFGHELSEEELDELMNHQSFLRTYRAKLLREYERLTTTVDGIYPTQGLASEFDTLGIRQHEISETTIRTLIKRLEQTSSGIHPLLRAELEKLL